MTLVIGFFLTVSAILIPAHNGFATTLAKFLERLHLNIIFIFILLLCCILLFSVLLLYLIIRKRKSDSDSIQQYREKQLVLDNMNIGYALHRIITDSNGIPVDYEFLQFNTEFERLTGMKSEQFLNRRILEVLPQTEKFWIERYGEVALNGESAEFISYAGELNKTFEVKAYSPGKGFFVTLFSDVSARESELALKELKHRISALFAIGQGEELYADLLDRLKEFFGTVYGYIGYLDEQENLVCPSMTREIFDRCRISDKSIVFPKESRQKGLWAESLKLQKTVCKNSRLIVPEGHLPLHNALAVPVLYHSRLIGQIVLGNKNEDFTKNDIDNLEEVADTVAPLMNAQRQEENFLNGLQKAKMIAEENNRLKNLFLSNISHELRTPLNGIMGMCALLGFTELTEKQQEIRNMLDSSGKRLLGVVEDLLQLTQIENQNVNLSAEKIQLPIVFNLLISSFTKAAQEKGLDFQFEFARTRTDFITDRMRLIQIVNNVVENAVKFTDEGLVSLKVGGEDELLLEVRDTGPGIPDDKLASILKSFSQLENVFTRNHGGLGIGLTIAHSLVNCLDGSMDIESRVGKGSLIRIRIPSMNSYSEEQVIMSPDEIGEKKDVKTGMNILVVEDDYINLQYTIRILRKHHHHVSKAVNGEQAVNLALRKRNDLDLILMDISMPVMDGLDALKKIKSVHGLEVPVVAVTAHAFDNEIARFLEQGFVDVLVKPFSEADLLRILEENI